MIPVVPQLLKVACSITGMGFSAIARVTDKRWIACSVQDDLSFGLTPGDELDVTSTLCHEVREFNKPIVIDHVEKDSKFCNHPTPKMYNFQSYISIPVHRKDGSFFGTLCAFDRKPAQLNNPKIIGTFELFADLISFHLNSIEEAQKATEQIEDQRKVSELREQFIGILGHDLRNPLASIRMIAEILLQSAEDQSGVRYANMLKSSSYRMDRLIGNMLDFARGRLGEGIIPDLAWEKEDLRKHLEQIVKELNVSSPAREVEMQLDLQKPVYCDSDRIGQLFSNLLTNADTHGEKGKPIQVSAVATEEHFVLKIQNAGEKIPESHLEHLFQPFFTEGGRGTKKGLGLGLYIASEIARAHKGTLEVTSTETETTFTFEMPNGPM